MTRTSGGRLKLRDVPIFPCGLIMPDSVFPVFFSRRVDILLHVNTFGRIIVLDGWTISHQGPEFTVVKIGGLPKLDAS